MLKDYQVWSSEHTNPSWSDANMLQFLVPPSWIRAILHAAIQMITTSKELRLPQRSKIVRENSAKFSHLGEWSSDLPPEKAKLQSAPCFPVSVGPAIYKTCDLGCAPAE